MSEEFKVPPDLAVVESQLRALPIANSGIDRDQLLYQSGWSAALASQELLTTSRKHGWAWPAATGLFATLAATLAIVLMQQFSRLDNDVVETKNVVQADIQQQDLESVSKQKAFDGFEALPEKKFTKRNSVTASDTSRRRVWIIGQSLTARSRFDQLDWQTVYETGGESDSENNDGAVAGADAKDRIEIEQPPASLGLVVTNLGRRHMRFLRQLLVFLVCLLASSASLADVTLVEEQTDRGKRMTFNMTVSPAAEPVPAMKYRLTVEPHKTIAGNSVTHLLRSDGENSLNRPWKTAIEKFGDEVYDWVGTEVPIKHLPLEKVREVSGWFDSYVEEHIARATICRDTDWGLSEEELTGMEAISFLLPSVQQTRSISRVLSIRTRLAIAEGRYDDAIKQLRMNYQLGQNVSKMKFLVAGLVGIAEIGIANQSMIDLIGAPDSPNMYWALAELPHPIINLRESMRLEMSFGSRLIPELMDVETAEHAEQEWLRMLSKALEAMSQIDGYIGNPSGERNPDSVFTNPLAIGGIGLATYEDAKQDLIDQGMDRAKVEAMPVAQVLMIDMAREYKRFADMYEKSLYVPFEKSEEMSSAVDRELNGLRGKLRLGRILAAQLLPAISQVRNASTRVESQRNLMMLIEAIRMHLAETGELPSTLADIKIVPVPLNPYDGTSFDYSCDGTSAILDLPFGYAPGYAVRFVIEPAK